MSGGSSILPLTHGVAQGSILGLLLFFIFMNDLSSFLPHGRLLPYTNDTKLLVHSLPDPIGLSSLGVQIEPEEFIQHLQNCFQGNGMKMNLDNTDFAVIGIQNSLKKAFDTVNIKILLEKLHKYCVRHKSLQIFSSYLSERAQGVKIRNAYSSYGSVTMGVP